MTPTQSWISDLPGLVVCATVLAGIAEHARRILRNRAHEADEGHRRLAALDAEVRDLEDRLMRSVRECAVCVDRQAGNQSGAVGIRSASLTPETRDE